MCVGGYGEHSCYEAGRIILKANYNLGHRGRVTLLGWSDRRGIFGARPSIFSSWCVLFLFFAAGALSLSGALLGWAGFLGCAALLGGFVFWARAKRTQTRASLYRPVTGYARRVLGVLRERRLSLGFAQRLSTFRRDRELYREVTRASEEICLRLDTRDELLVQYRRAGEEPDKLWIDALNTSNTMEIDACNERISRVESRLDGREPVSYGELLSPVEAAQLALDRTERVVRKG